LHEVFLSIPSVRYTDKAEDQPGRAFEGRMPGRGNADRARVGVIGGGKH
jgi:hypothetical protein